MSSHAYTTLETALITEFDMNDPYHIEALCFLNRKIAKGTSKNKISNLMQNLQKTRSDPDVISHLKECLVLMADYDDNFKRYLRYFPGDISHKPGMLQPVPQSTDPVKAPYKPAAKPEAIDMDESLTDIYVMNLHKHLDVGKLKEFAVIGLRIKTIEYNNAVEVLSDTKEKIGRICNHWRGIAPLDHLQFNSKDPPPYTKRGLKYALKECDHNNAIYSLGLQ
ncbi:hypothetical protein LOD99_7346 [Oopsacas minuta]|uniref:Uncharacterized protein n=1 Tax=Oopsacas minuta TaxID=111878 RepID=A0AAV7JU64_9METZ|nr:hypothetical protein LOD99_7346 [Oopsacas minuta]